MESIVDYQLKNGDMFNVALIKDIVEKDEFKLNETTITMKPDYDKYCLNGDFDYSAEEFKKIYPTFRDYAYSMLLITPIVIDIDGNIQLRGPVFKKTPQKSA